MVLICHCKTKAASCPAFAGAAGVDGGDACHSIHVAALSATTAAAFCHGNSSSVITRNMHCFVGW